MCVYIFVHTSLYIHISIYNFVCTNLYTQIWIYQVVYTNVYIQICIYTFVYTNLHLQMCIYKFVSCACARACTCTHTCTCTCTHLSLAQRCKQYENNSASTITSRLTYEIKQHLGHPLPHPGPQISRLPQTHAKLWSPHALRPKLTCQHWNSGRAAPSVA